MKLKRIKKVGKLTLLVFCASYFTVMVIWNTWFPYNYNVYDTVEDFNSQSVIHHTVFPAGEFYSNSNTTKYILLWTRYFYSKNWDLRDNDVNADLMNPIRCNTKNCVVTSDRNLLSSPLDYDAIVFHTAQPWIELGQAPAKRDPHQLYVMAILESPVHTRHNLQKDYDFFNMTMTYRLDSDVIWHDYGVFIDRQTGEQVAPLRDGRKPIWRTPGENFFDQHIFNQVKRKSKMGAWFVSHCGAASRRDRLVKKLQRLLSIDVYGDCGQYKCLKFSDYCDNILDKDYKFYMAFENSLCEDYVTEKFFGTMKRLIIPVVYGGADYSRFAPLNSYINANDFASVDDLAEYMMFLDQNPREYVKYFWWKQYYRIEEPSPFCDLCQKVHKTIDRGVEQYYGDIESWWATNRCKAKARIKF